VGLSFDYCDGTKRLLLADGNDKSFQQLIAIKVQEGNVTQFQMTLIESLAEVVTGPAFVGFTNANKIS
jgi:hypothetical protein